MSPVSDPDPMHVENGGELDEIPAPLSLPEREPLVILSLAVAAVTAIVHVVVVFGISIPDGADHAIAGAVDAVGLLALVLTLRPKVTPSAKVLARVTTKGTVVTGPAASVPAGVEIDDTGLAPVDPSLVKPGKAS